MVDKQDTLIAIANVGLDAAMVVQRIILLDDCHSQIFDRVAAVTRELIDVYKELATVLKEEQND